MSRQYCSNLANFTQEKCRDNIEQKEILYGKIVYHLQR